MLFVGSRHIRFGCRPETAGRCCARRCVCLCDDMG